MPAGCQGAGAGAGADAGAGAGGESMESRRIALRERSLLRVPFRGARRTNKGPGGRKEREVREKGEADVSIDRSMFFLR